MSDHVTVQHVGLVSTITFNKPPLNLMDAATLDALLVAHQAADAHPETRVMVTRSGVDGIFGNGLDPAHMLSLSQHDRIDVFRAVGRMMQGIYGCMKPHISVINGPAMAGGAVLAVLSDFRYIDEDKGRICFAEAKVGVPIPAGATEMLRVFCQPNWLVEVTMMGKNLNAKLCLEAGLADGIAPADKLEAMVQKQIDRITRLSPAVLRSIKEGIRGPILERIDGMLQGDDDATHEFGLFAGDEYLGEGLTALLEGRAPVFAK